MNHRNSMSKEQIQRVLDLERKILEVVFREPVKEQKQEPRPTEQKDKATNK